MILGGWFYLHGIAPAIAEHYEKVLLPNYCVEHQLGTFSSSYYLYSVRALIRAALCEQEKEGREFGNCVSDSHKLLAIHLSHKRI